MSPNMFKRLFCCAAADDDLLPPPTIHPSRPPTPPIRPPAPLRPHIPYHHLPPHLLPPFSPPHCRPSSVPPPPSPPPCSPPPPPPHSKNFFKGNGSWRESDTIKRIQAGPFASDPRPPRPALPRKPIWQLRAELKAARDPGSRESSGGSLVTIVPGEQSIYPVWRPPKELKYRFPSSSSSTYFNSSKS